MISEDELYKKANTHLEKKLPLAIYRKPKECALNLFLQKDKNLYKYDKYTSGFLFSRAFEKEKYLIPLEKSHVFKLSINSNINKILANPLVLQNVNKEAYLSLINRAKNRIKACDLQKVVLSRKVVANCHDGLDVFAIFKKMESLYHDAFVYMWHHPSIGIWIGATPELSLNSYSNTFKTISLAATRDALLENPPKWTLKEKTEQLIVTQYIVKKLKPLTNNLIVSSSENVLAGNLWHIKTAISGVFKENITWENIVDELSPTPAVCGVPKKTAQNFIIENEGYDRVFYTGLVGEVLEREVRLFVNIRCMTIEKSTLKIFVGAGITKDSIPEHEWLETQKKSKTMLDVLLGS